MIVTFGAVILKHQMWSGEGPGIINRLPATNRSRRQPRNRQQTGQQRYRPSPKPKPIASIMELGVNALSNFSASANNGHRMNSQ
jgi:hypothetical protein